mgnify:CR=1 FL=1
MQRFIIFLLSITMGVYLASCSNNNDIDGAKKAIKDAYPDITVDNIRVFNDKFFEVTVQKEIFYMTKDYENLVAGNIIELKTGENLTEKTKENARISLINNLDTSGMIIYKPKKTNHVITVFTDTSCPYCKKLHNEIDNLITNNIEVRYVLFSRNGNNDDAFRQMVSIWCSSDRLKNLDAAFDGNFIENDNSCENPISKNYASAQSLGVTGTPMMFTGDGKLISGYQPSRAIIAYLEKLSSN